MKLKTTYQKLNDFFYTPKLIQKSDKLEVITTNKQLMSEFNISEKQIIKLFNGQYSSNPIAMSYSAHQFGYFTTLGDGRACLLGDSNGYEFHLKGSGRTNYSRGGDGLASLESCLKENLYSKYLDKLRIKTTKILAVVKTNEQIFRNKSLDGAITCRVALSHVRIGTFEHAYINGKNDDVLNLANYCIDNIYPELKNIENKYFYFFLEVCKNQAILISNYITYGFVHGVLNTDNVLISGEAIDFGPCAFIDKYITNQTYSSIDVNARYSFYEQKEVMLFNLARLGETLQNLFLDDSSITDGLEHYQTNYNINYYQKMSKRLGLKDINIKQVDSFINILTINNLDYNNCFLYLIGNKDYDYSQYLGSFKDFCNPIKMINYNPRFPLRNKVAHQSIQDAINGDFTQYNKLLLQIDSLYDENLDTTNLNTVDYSYSHITYCGT